ncbi:hypothetical protein HOLleu_29830 [Holothuria leucospilota]|uniref:Ig-like domain-containing protein n=1 Tax=Holothuria leucospilota TaxID=206669 RepID=A0A9Q1GXY5_HOLLE|nr:hypothetical protein HOLleu_29830 [Holothuria leucospilota]
MMVFLCRNFPALLCLFGLLIFISKGMKGEQFHSLDVRLVLFGSTTKLECVIGETNSEFTITWISNDDAFLSHSSKQLTVQKERKYESVLTNDTSVAVLYISHVTLKDAGIYKCSVSFHSAGKSRRSSWIVNVQGQPIINISPLLDEKEPSMVECCVEFAFVLVMREVEITWRMDGEILHSQIIPRENGTTSASVETVCSRTTLYLNRLHHRKKLQCFVGDEFSASAHVNVNVSYLTNVDVIVGTVYNPSNKVDVEKDENINITCVSHGYPSSNISLQRPTKENDWVNTPMEAYAVKQNMTMTSQTFLYNSTKENSGTFRCTANNDDLTEQSKEFQIRVHGERLPSTTSQDPKSSSDNPRGPDGSSGPNNNQTLLIVCVGMAIVITLIVTNRSKESIKINPCRLKLSNLRRRGRDDSIYTDMSQGVPDVCRDPSGATQTANSVFYYVLEKDDYETVEHNDLPVRERSENTTAVAGNAIAFYAKVNKTKIEKDANAKEMKEQQHVMDTDDETSFSNYAYVQKLK